MKNVVEIGIKKISDTLIIIEKHFFKISFCFLLNFSLKFNLLLSIKTIIENIDRVLKQAGSCLEDIIRLRIYVTDISRWEEAGNALGEFFKTIKPAQTLVGISALVDPDMLVEIEAEAVTVLL